MRRSYASTLWPRRATANEAPSAWCGLQRRGSFATTQRWVHHLDAFTTLGVDEQQEVIGRTKLDSVELDNAHKPPTAHIARVVVEEDGAELEIYRRRVPYGTVTELVLYFVPSIEDLARVLG